MASSKRLARLGQRRTLVIEPAGEVRRDKLDGKHSRDHWDGTAPVACAERRRPRFSPGKRDRRVTPGSEPIQWAALGENTGQDTWPTDHAGRPAGACHDGARGERRRRKSAGTGRPLTSPDGWLGTRTWSGTGCRTCREPARTNSGGRTIGVSGNGGLARRCWRMGRGGSRRSTLDKPERTLWRFRRAAGTKCDLSRSHNAPEAALLGRENHCL
jgi:hypothetical protein